MTAACELLDRFLVQFAILIALSHRDKTLTFQGRKHGVCGCFGTLAVGLFDYTDGLFYGGGVHHLLIQLLGVVCIAGWAIICDLILFTILKKTVGVRVSEREELEGLDATEHGLETGYAGFLMDKDN